MNTHALIEKNTTADDFSLNMRELYLGIPTVLFSLGPSTMD